jgi:hypothetical protein
MGCGEVIASRSRKVEKRATKQGNECPRSFGQLLHTKQEKQTHSVTTPAMVCSPRSDVSQKASSRTSARIRINAMLTGSAVPVSASFLVGYSGKTGIRMCTNLKYPYTASVKTARDLRPCPRTRLTVMGESDNRSKGLPRTYIVFSISV